MCGISGFINYQEKQDRDLLKRSLDIINHRGPDEDGMFFDDERFSMGMRRLSIIDLAHGKQPIYNEDETVLVVFNGEIYNYLELKTELEVLGHIFKTQSDTEILVHGYEEWGEGLPKKLRGMFAFCIFDRKTNKLFIARDHFGIKPIYYHLRDNKITAFASEIKSILEDKTVKKDVNIPYIYDYSSFQYNPNHETFFKNIYRLSPGHHIEIDLNNGEYNIEKYWQWNFNTIRDTDYEKSRDNIKNVLKDSVKHHMIADVPVASFLSSGVDSSIIAMLAQKEMQSQGKTLKTFTIGFKDLDSEIKDVKEFADFIKTDHKEIVVSFDDYFESLKKCVWHFDEPIADPSAISLFLLSREVAKEVKVVMSGEGADEVFGGYGIYREPHDKYIQLVSLQPVWFKKYFLKPLLKAVNYSADIFPILSSFPGISFLNRALTPVRYRYIGNAHIFKEIEKEKLFKGYKSQNMVNKLDLQDQDLSKFSESEYMQFVDIQNWMRGDILQKADKMTMANSLELRVPFLDIEVAKTAYGLIDDWKYKNDTTKYILRDAFAKDMPEKTNKRPKLGFPTPWHIWLKKDHKKVLDIIIENKLIQDICNIDYIKSLFTEHRLNDKFVGRRIFTLLMLALWYNTFINDYR
jgi:asparagine synthase (glutamine-hydrolysing)